MSYAPLARSLVRELQPDLAIGSIQTLEERLNEMLANRRLYAVVLVGLASLALAIAGVGLFGVLASGVAERTRELAVRAALGATPASLVHLVVRQALLVSAIGLAIGSSAALLMARTARALLFGIGPDDLRVYAVTALCILSVAAFAAVVPARRAAHGEPLTLLKGN
jgi:ABC-type antimicrobial peptide transport system permease subunit